MRQCAGTRRAKVYIICLFVCVGILPVFSKRTLPVFSKRTFPATFVCRHSHKQLQSEITYFPVLIFGNPYSSIFFVASVAQSVTELVSPPSKMSHGFYFEVCHLFIEVF